MKNTQDNLSLSNLKRRVNGKTPPFWEKVKMAGLVIAGIGGIIAAPATAGLTLPASLTILSTVLGSVGASMMFTAKLATMDNHKPLDEN